MKEDLQPPGDSLFLSRCPQAPLSGQGWHLGVAHTPLSPLFHVTARVPQGSPRGLVWQGTPWRRHCPCPPTRTARSVVAWLWTGGPTLRAGTACVTLAALTSSHAPAAPAHTQASHALPLTRVSDTHSSHHPTPHAPHSRPLHRSLPR